MRRCGGGRKDGPRETLGAGARSFYGSRCLVMARCLAWSTVGTDTTLNAFCSHAGTDPDAGRTRRRKTGRSSRLGRVHPIPGVAPHHSGCPAPPTGDASGTQTQPPHNRSHATGKLLVFNHKKHERVVRHFLHGLRSHPVELTAYPVMFAAGVDAGFVRFVVDS